MTVLNLGPKRLVSKPLREAVAQTILLHAPKDSQVTVMLCGLDEMQRLNQEHRSVDRATDVLSFPAPAFAAPELGDIAVSLDHAQRQADRRKVRLIDEAAMLAVHGTLHLVGFDDGTDHERAVMLREMNKVMALVGLPTEEAWESLPYEETE